MMTLDAAQFVPAMPEIFLACMCMLLLMMGVFARVETSGAVVGVFSRLTMVGIAGLLLMIWQEPNHVQYAFPRLFDSPVVGAMFKLDDFNFVLKVMLVLAAFGALYLPHAYFGRRAEYPFEVYVLYSLSVLGMMMALSANDLLSLYIGLELMSFALYILAAINRDDAASSEAGLKYFVLGSLASGIILFGMSLLYGASADTGFSAIRATLQSLPLHENMMLTVGVMFVLVGLLFKLSAVPFHMWTPDVYQGAPLPVTAFMAVVVKIAAFGIALRVLFDPFLPVFEHWQGILAALSAFSVVLGALLAIMQQNLKRLFAYSSITHVGFLLLGVATGSADGVQAVLFYLVAYAAMTLGAFTVLLAAQRSAGRLQNVTDLAGLAKRKPVLAAAMAVFMFSLAGLPPLAGFWAKLFILQTALAEGLLPVVIPVMLGAVVALFYSLRIVKTMYFDEPAANTKHIEATPASLSIVLLVCSGITLFAGLFPSTLLDVFMMAARSLLLFS